MEAAVTGGTTAKEAQKRAPTTQPTRAGSPPSPATKTQKIVVPVMGEGIRAAKVVSLLKKTGDKIDFDDPLCELETDKAVYPIESSWVGTMGEWKVKLDEMVEIGQELATIFVEGGDVSLAEQMQSAAEVSPDKNGAPVVAAVPPSSAESKLTRGDARSYSSDGIEPALSPTITRRLGRVVPANLQIDARWDALRRAREAARKSKDAKAISPSVMIAWAVVRAMEKHAPFRRIILEDDQIVEHNDFDIGIAVAMEGDRLATAVITHANQCAWPDFVRRYNQTVEETRAGRVDAVNAPVVISSLGAFGVRVGMPIVVPPSIGTLFVGSAHFDTIAHGKRRETAEVITLSLTFDHRVVNGAGAANFVHEIKQEIEKFKIPKVGAAH
jgi:pyruvate/2-oxoglutarate dehydrogenase complex dihydrolipoamide acyltransferase (E2) component